MDGISEARAALDAADAVLVGAGAGMGVDSGLPDFRGAEGFWRAYPPFRELGLSFEEMASPHHFQENPTLGWGFYGHRLHLYRDVVPHRGFELLDRLIGSRPRFVFTSNVDGGFQRAGWGDHEVVEIHGSIHHLQCLEGCTERVWSADGTDVDVDPATFRARPPLPRCPGCGGAARPNVMMFGDWGWSPVRSDAQARRYSDWLEEVRDRRIVAIEMGAGTTLPSVRYECERRGDTLVRINPRESHGPPGTVSIAAGALAALEAIAAE